VVRCCSAFSYLETRRRRVLAALFISMGVVNTIAMLSNPRAYTDLYGDRAWLPFYRSILNGFVADNEIHRHTVPQIAAGILDLGPVLMLALAFINTAGLLMLAFDFTSYGEQIEARERSREVDDAGMATNSADQLTRQPRRAQGTWRVFALVEVLLAAAAVAFDLFLPTIVILLLASISLAIRRTGPSSVGFRRVRRPARMALAVFVLTVGWSLVQLGLTMPILNRLTGQRQNLSQFEGLQGNVTMLLILLGLSWTLAALGEETAYRGYLPTRISEVFGQSRAANLLAVGISSVLFALAHTEQGVIGVGPLFSMPSSSARSSGAFERYGPQCSRTVSATRSEW
jgi:uncharacterized protein